MSAPNLAAFLARAPARTPTAARVTQSVSALAAAEAGSHRIGAAIGSGDRKAMIETGTATAHEETVAQAPPSTPTSDTTQSGSKPAAAPSDLKEFLEQYDPDHRLDSKAVLKFFCPVDRHFKCATESIEKYVADDGSFRAGDGEIVIPYLLGLVEAMVAGHAAEFWLKRIVPDSNPTVKKNQTFTVNIV